RSGDGPDRRRLPAAGESPGRGRVASWAATLSKESGAWRGDARTKEKGPTRKSAPTIKTKEWIRNVPRQRRPFPLSWRLWRRWLVFGGALFWGGREGVLRVSWRGWCLSRRAFGGGSRKR